MDLNKVMLIGRLTRDPETRTIGSGQTVANFSIATSRQWTDQGSGEKKSVTEYHNIVAWRKLAEICQQYLRKGSQIYLEGYLQTRSWDDPSGNKRYKTEVVADNMIMLGGKGGSGQGAAPAPAQPQDMGSTPPPPQAQPAEDTISVEDIPF